MSSEPAGDAQGGPGRDRPGGARGLALLRHRNLRLYLIGQTISQSGTWMQTVALGWLVIELTGSGSLLGLVTAAQFLPVLVFGAFAGALSDRLSRWHMLQTTQVLAGVLAAGLGALVATDAIGIGGLFVLAAAIGTVNAFDTPVRSSFTYEMVGDADLTGAIGLTSSMNSMSRIVGPAIAAGLIALFGLPVCFFVNAASYLVCIATFLMMRRDELEPKPPAPSRKGQVREGVRLVWADPRLRTPLLMTVVVGALAYENQISLPLFAEFTFDGDAGSYGLLSSALGVGSVLGGLVVARWGRGTHRRLGMATVLLGTTMLVASTMPTLAAMSVALVTVGLGSVAFLTMTSSVLQLTAPPSARGRVLALYVTAIIGTTPVGGPIIGWIGETIGPRATYVTGGLACLVVAAVAWRSLAHAHEEEVGPAELAEIEERAVREAEDVDADSASAMPRSLSVGEAELSRRRGTGARCFTGGRGVLRSAPTGRGDVTGRRNRR